MTRGVKLYIAKMLLTLASPRSKTLHFIFNYEKLLETATPQ